MNFFVNGSFESTQSRKQCVSLLDYAIRSPVVDVSSVCSSLFLPAAGHLCGPGEPAGHVPSHLWTAATLCGVLLQASSVRQDGNQTRGQCQIQPGRGEQSWLESAWLSFLNLSFCSLFHEHVQQSYLSPLFVSLFSHFQLVHEAPLLPPFFSLVLISIPKPFCF